MPGYLRRFVPKKGSGYTPFSTRAASTVTGPASGYQPSGRKSSVDRTLPVSFTFAEDWTTQPLVRISAPGGSCGPELEVATTGRWGSHERTLARQNATAMLLIKATI